MGSPAARAASDRAREGFQRGVVGAQYVEVYGRPSAELARVDVGHGVFRFKMKSIVLSLWHKNRNRAIPIYWNNIRIL